MELWRRRVKVSGCWSLTAGCIWPQLIFPSIPMFSLLFSEPHFCSFFLFSTIIHLDVLPSLTNPVSSPTNFQRRSGLFWLRAYGKTHFPAKVDYKYDTVQKGSKKTQFSKQAKLSNSVCHSIIYNPSEGSSLSELFVWAVYCCRLLHSSCPFVYVLPKDEFTLKMGIKCFPQSFRGLPHNICWWLKNVPIYFWERARLTT